LPAAFAALRDIDEQIDALPREPAIVLFHYNRGDNPIAEPMHNIDAAWPDDQLIIRAHDLGDRNRELFKYYAKREPDRKIYYCGRDGSGLSYMGTVAELAR
jgi:hypothetical protein